MSNIEICTIGGYNEVGRNMSAIRIDEDVIIADMGVDMEKYIKLQEDREGLKKVSRQDMISSGASPDDSVINKWKDNVKAIVCTHAHLDHIASVPFLASKYNCPIIGTAFTIEILKRLFKDNKIKPKNKFKSLNKNDTYPISKDIELEFVEVTHSVVQTVLLAIKSKEGTVIYANDFKFDMTPTLGKKSDPERLKKIKNVKVLIVDSVYSKSPMRMPSEAVPRAMLKNILLEVSAKGNAVFVTTFASHLARLKSIIDFGKKTGRKIIFLGRSLHKYTDAAEKLKIIDFSKHVEMYSYKKEISKVLREVEKNRGRYLVVVTGHQGEPKAVMSRIANKEFPFTFKKNDIVIFSSNVIPTKTNKDARKILDNKLKSYGVRLFTNIHASGHGAKEDLRILIDSLKPEHIIPAHAPINMQKGLLELGLEMKYDKKKVHLMHNGQFVKIKS
jgi:ribonuclease J